MTQTNNEREAYLSKVAGYANTLGINSVDSFRLLAFIESISQNEQQEAVGYVRYQRCALNTRDENGDVCMIPHAHLTNRDVIDGAKLYTSPPKQATPNGWISVKDRLPEDSKTVICADYGNFKINEYSPAPDEIFGCNFYKGDWLGDAFGDYPYIVKVTHWMPLPEAPNNTEVGE